MDATKIIQIAVARADLAICQARASPWWIIAAGLLVGAVYIITTLKGDKHK